MPTASELVGRLRARRENVWDGASQDYGWQEDALCLEAASEIERLETEVAATLVTKRTLRDQLEGSIQSGDAARRNHAVAEAQRDKLAEALRKIVSTYDRNWQHQREKLDDCVPLAREALADLEPKP